MNWSSTLLLIAITLAVLMMSTSGCTQRRPSINADIQGDEALAWHESLDSAITEAKQRRTFIVVDVYTNRCSWCKRMEKSTLCDSDVKNQLRKFSLLKLNAREQSKLAKRYRVRALPTTLVLDDDGEVIARKARYLAPGSYLKFINTATAPPPALASR